jgi:hypothetical protein
MASIVTPLAASLLPLSLAWGALGMPVNGNGTWAEEEQTAPLRSRCQLRVDDDGESIVLITKGWVNFYQFARFFRDGLGCRNLLCRCVVSKFCSVTTASSKKGPL